MIWVVVLLYNTNMPANSTLKTEGEKDLVSWIAPARPFKRRNREFFVTVGVMAFVVALVLFAVEGVLPVILVISLVFLFYVMSTVEPENIEYKITSLGVKIANKRTDWELMRRFWFTKRLDSELLVIETANLAGRLECVIKPEMKEELKKAISDYLLYEELPPSYLDKATNWVSRKMPGNK